MKAEYFHAEVCAVLQERKINLEDFSVGTALEALDFSYLEKMEFTVDRVAYMVMCLSEAIAEKGRRFYTGEEYKQRQGGVG